MVCKKSLKMPHIGCTMRTYLRREPTLWEGRSTTVQTMVHVGSFGFGDRFEGDLFGLLLGGFEFAVDGYVGVLIESGIRFHARFGFGTASEDRVIMVEETDAPVESCKGVIMLECVRSALCLFDEVAVRHTGGRP